MKIILLGRFGRKKLLKNLAIVFTAMFLIAAAGTQITHTAASARDLPIYSVESAEKKLCFTFDAAWGNEDTEELISIFDKYKIKVTFFVVGEWADKYPESVKALYDAGHEVMNHSATHAHMTQLGKTDMQEEVRLCADKIEAITGIRPTLFRPPYGEYDNNVVGAARNEGHFTIQWDVDSLDWKGISANEIAERVRTRVKNGSIVLFHNAAKNTPAALPSLIESLLQDGYSFVKVSDLILKDDYTIDHTGRQIANPPSASPLPSPDDRYLQHSSASA